MINALLRVQLRFRRMEKVCKDQGTKEVNRVVAGRNGLLQLEEVKDAPVIILYSEHTRNCSSYKLNRM